MIADDYRGWAWTRALLGLRADEIHLCGDESALPLVEKIVNHTGDELETHRYERFKPLKVDKVNQFVLNSSILLKLETTKMFLHFMDFPRLHSKGTF